MRYAETKGRLYDLRQELYALIAREESLVDDLIASDDSDIESFRAKVEVLNAARISTARKHEELTEAEKKAYNRRGKRL